MFSISIDVDGQAQTGRVLNTKVSREGADLETSFESQLPMLPVGGLFRCSVTSSEGGDVFDLTARLVLQAPRGDEVRCVFACQLEDSPQLISLMNQRRSVRIRPSATLPVRAELPTGAQVAVFDLSATGISLLVAEEALQPNERWRTRVTLTLPTCDEPFDMDCHIRVRKLSGAAVLYGLEFDHRSPDFEAKLEQVEQYLFRRQAEILQERARRKHA